MANDPSAKLRNLVATHDEPIEGIVRRVVRELGGLRERAIIELRLLGGENPNSVTKFTVVLSHAGASLLPNNVQNPTLLAITTVETFREMVNGSYSPFSAHMDGKLTVQGNVELGLKVFGHFAAPGVQTPTPHTPTGPTGGPSQPVLCPTLVNESWSQDSPGSVYGSLTVSGEFFTAGGTVVINYNYSICSSQYQQTLTADASGRFTVTQDGIPCENSPLPARYYGVGVTAFDNSSGLNTFQNYHIPCGL
jgi:SCP-2 sterol transfer family protein